jgi:hypothetical protein
MLPRLKKLDGYAYYFQFTLTPSGADAEPGLPDKKTALLQRFKKMSETLGPERVVWRYDPILINDNYSIDYHLNTYAFFAKELSGFTDTCVVSFIDAHYRGAASNAGKLCLLPITDEVKITLLNSLAGIAAENGIQLRTCATEINIPPDSASQVNLFQENGIHDMRGISPMIRPARCIDKDLLEKISGKPINAPKDKNQRPGCGCSQSVDIGAYNTCGNGCLYCYANYMKGAVKTNMENQDPSSPFLCS